MASRMKNFKYKKSYSAYKKAAKKFASKHNVGKLYVTKDDLLSKREYELRYSQLKDEGKININRIIIADTKAKVEQMKGFKSDIDIAYDRYKSEVNRYFQKEELSYDYKKLTKSQFGSAWVALREAGEGNIYQKLLSKTKFVYSEKQASGFAKNIKAIKEALDDDPTRINEMYNLYGQSTVDTALMGVDFSIKDIKQGKTIIDLKELARQEYDRLTANIKTGQVEYEEYYNAKGELKRRRVLKGTLAEKMDMKKLIGYRIFGSK